MKLLCVAIVACLAIAGGSIYAVSSSRRVMLKESGAFEGASGEESQEYPFVVSEGLKYLYFDFRASVDRGSVRFLVLGPDGETLVSWEARAGDSIPQSNCGGWLRLGGKTGTFRLHVTGTDASGTWRAYFRESWGPGEKPFLALAVSIPVALAVSLTIWGLSYRRWRKWWGRRLAASGE